MTPLIDELPFNIDPDYTSDDTSVKAIALQNPELRGRSPRTPFVSGIRTGDTLRLWDLEDGFSVSRFYKCTSSLVSPTKSLRRLLCSIRQGNSFRTDPYPFI